MTGKGSTPKEPAPIIEERLLDAERQLLQATKEIIELQHELIDTKTELINTLTELHHKLKDENRQLKADIKLLGEIFDSQEEPENPSSTGEENDTTP